MKLSSKTIEILKNFASIYPTVDFYAGNKQFVVKPDKTVVAIAEFEEEFPANWSIYDLNTFCATLSSLEDPEIELHDKHCVISSGDIKIEYRYSFDDNQHDYYEKVMGMKLPSEDVKFELRRDVYESVFKLASILKLTRLIIEGDGESIYVSAVNPELGKDGSSSNKVRHKVSDTDKTFVMSVKLERLRFLPDDYDVVISKAKMLEFIGKTRNIKYFMGCEGKESRFEG